MSGGIYLIQNDGQPVEMSQQKYGSETFFKRCLPGARTCWLGIK